LSERGLRPLWCSRAPAKGGGRGDGVREPIKGLTGGRGVVRWPGDGGEQAVAVSVTVRGSLELRERERRESGGAVLSGGALGGFCRVGEGAHASGDGGQWWWH
jgi:hypothetical protein